MGVGPPHGYEGGGSGRSHPENADPDQQVAKKDEAKYTLLVEWKKPTKVAKVIATAILD